VDVSEMVVGPRAGEEDEMENTGETLAMVAERAREQGATEAIRATMVTHSQAAPRPEVVALETDALVIFPWDEEVLVEGRWGLHPELRSARSQQPEPPAA